MQHAVLVVLALPEATGRTALPVSTSVSLHELAADCKGLVKGGIVQKHLHIPAAVGLQMMHQQLHLAVMYPAAAY
jgi:hypothetical protein